MKTEQAKVLIQKQMQLGEGPLWNVYMQKFHFVDIENRRIYTYDANTKALNHISLEHRVGCIVPTENGNLLAGVTNRLLWIDNHTKKQKVIKDFHLKDGIRFNDGKCDCKGRLLIGTMAIEQNAPYAKTCGELYSCDYAENPKRLLSDLAIPNGLAFSKDNRTLYHIDTASQAIMAYSYDKNTGNIGKENPVIRFPIEYGSPDGMCIDENDNLWVALWGGYKVVCVDTKQKEVIREIHVDAKYVSCCTFGGKDLNELFITSAMDENGSGGQVFHISLDVKGTLPYPFRMEK